MIVDSLTKRNNVFVSACIPVSSPVDCPFHLKFHNLWTHEIDVTSPWIYVWTLLKLLTIRLRPPPSLRRMMHKTVEQICLKTHLHLTEESMVSANPGCLLMTVVIDVSQRSIREGLVGCRLSERQRSQGFIICLSHWLYSKTNKQKNNPEEGHIWRTLFLSIDNLWFVCAKWPRCKIVVYCSRKNNRPQ